MGHAQHLAERHGEPRDVGGVEQDTLAANDSLEADDHETDPTEAAQPRPGFRAVEPDRKGDGDEPHRGAGQAMRMFGEHRDIVEPTGGVD